MTEPRSRAVRSPSTRIVVDASAVLTLLIDPGPSGESVAERLQRATAFAPAVLPFEVANVLRRRRNAGLLSDAEASLARDRFLDLPIELWPWQTYSRRAWALGANLSSYDASYVALAEELGAPLLTRDARLAAAPGVGCEVLLT